MNLLAVRVCERERNGRSGRSFHRQSLLLSRPEFFVKDTNLHSEWHGRVGGSRSVCGSWRESRRRRVVQLQDEARRELARGIAWVGSRDLSRPVESCRKVGREGLSSDERVAGSVHRNRGALVDIRTADVRAKDW